MDIKFGTTPVLDSMLRRINVPKGWESVKNLAAMRKGNKDSKDRSPGQASSPHSRTRVSRDLSEYTDKEHVIQGRSKSSSEIHPIRTMMPGHMDNGTATPDDPLATQTLTIRRISRQSTDSCEHKRGGGHFPPHIDLSHVEVPRKKSKRAQSHTKLDTRPSDKSFLLRRLFESSASETIDTPVEEENDRGASPPGSDDAEDHGTESMQQTHKLFSPIVKIKRGLGGWGSIRAMLRRSRNKVVDYSQANHKHSYLPDMKEKLIRGRRTSTESKTSQLETQRTSSIGLDQLRKTSVIASKWRMRSTMRAVMTLAPFVPKLLKDIIRNLEFGERTFRFTSTQEASQTVARRLHPRMTTFRGAVMVADITGFTSLTEILSKEGTSGIELLTKCINNFFSEVIDLVCEYEGDVTKFAGDSLIVAFYPNEEEKTGEEAFRKATLRCVQCAHNLAETLGHMRMLPTGKIESVSSPGDNQNWRKSRSLVQAATALRKAGTESRTRTLNSPARALQSAVQQVGN